MKAQNYRRGGYISIREAIPFNGILSVEDIRNGRILFLEKIASDKKAAELALKNGASFVPIR